MSKTPYFDAYMKGERSSSHKMKTAGFSYGASAACLVAGFDPALISLIRRSMPNLIAHDLVGVQPMTMPTGQTYTIPFGTYTLNSTVTIPPNTTIRGEGFRPTYMRNS